MEFLPTDCPVCIPLTLPFPNPLSWAVPGARAKRKCELIRNRHPTMRVGDNWSIIAEDDEDMSMQMSPKHDTKCRRPIKT